MKVSNIKKLLNLSELYNFLKINAIIDNLNNLNFCFFVFLSLVAGLFYESVLGLVICLIAVVIWLALCLGILGICLIYERDNKNKENGFKEKEIANLIKICISLFLLTIWFSCFFFGI